MSLNCCASPRRAHGIGVGMLEWLDRIWRTFGTAISFAVFGLSCLLLAVCVFPCLYLVVREPVRRSRVARRSVHLGHRFFIGLMRWFGLLTYEIRGAEKLRREGLLILANHPTLIDAVFLIGLVPNANCVVKASLARNFFTRGPIRAANYISNDSGAGLVGDCVASLKMGDNLVMFPEGTRTRQGEPMCLQRGAANIALRGPCDITPVTIRCEPISLTKGAPWWRVPTRPMHFTIEVGDDIPVAGFLAHAEGKLPLAARRLTDHLHTYFTQEQPIHAVA